MDMQKLAYFAEGNIFTGSATKDAERACCCATVSSPTPRKGN